MPRKPKAAAAAALTITADCERNGKGYGALAFVQHINFIANPQAVSAAKKHLLKAGFESLDIGLMEWIDADVDAQRAEISIRWDEEDCVLGWDPRGADDPGWALVAVLMLREDGHEVHDAVAILARPANVTPAWPFPAGKPGESGPEVKSEPVLGDVVLSDGTPATITENPERISKTDAHLSRKSAQFELLEPTDALLRTFTPRVEKHGEDDVSAASLGLTIEAPNTILDLLAPSLRPTLYAAPEGQVTLPGVEESTPLLRTKVIETLKLTPCFEGWTLVITAGISEADNITIGDCKVDKFVVTPRDGGSVQLDLRIGSNDIDEHDAGWLYGHLRHEIEITLHAPVVKPDAIDGTQGHPGAAPGPDAGDLFRQAHGRSEDGAPQEPGEGGEERQAEEQTS